MFKLYVLKLNLYRFILDTQLNPFQAISNTFNSNICSAKLVIVDCLHEPCQAITSFKSATNGAGAWVGGYLADKTGDYRAGFVLTASVQMICAVSYVPVAFMVP